MFFELELTKSVEVPPQFLGPSLQSTIEQLLQNDVEGTVTGRHGFVIAVTAFEPLPKGRIREGVGSAEFDVTYRCMVFRPFRHQVLDATVYDVNKMGFFAEAGPVEIFVSQHLIPSHYAFNNEAEPVFESSEGATSIHAGSTVRVRVLRAKVELNNIVLPQGHNKQQKVAVGDSSGVLQVFSLKGGVLVSAFKTLPSGDPITHVALGRGLMQRDKVFVASDGMVRGVTKKGKEFYRFATTSTEQISSCHVVTDSMWLSGGHSLQHFVDGKEMQQFIVPDRINDADMVPLSEAGTSSISWCAALACQDRCLRVVHGATMLHQVTADAAVTAVRHVAVSHDHSPLNAGRVEVLYGTELGVLVQLLLDLSSSKEGWRIRHPTRRAAVQAIASSIDFSRDGVNDVLLGREDGSVELWGLDVQQQPVLLWSGGVGESVTSIDGGYITSPNVQDFLVQTYSGKVIAFTEPEGLAAAATPLRRSATGSKKDGDAAAGMAERVATLQQDVDDLQLKVAAMRSSYAAVGGQLVAVGAQFDLRDRLALDAEDGCHVLTVETGAPIFALALQADVPLHLHESQVAILSRTPPDAANGNGTLATYRCQESTNRVEVRIRIVEGRRGTLQAWVVPQTAPRTCQAVTHHLRPLCMHQRQPGCDAPPPMSELRITGAFSQADLHMWLLFCLPEVQSRPPADPHVTLWFRHVLLGTVLMCQYRQGEGIFQSNNLSALAVLREFIMREATAAKAHIQFTFNLEPASMYSACGLIWPRLMAQTDLQRQLLMLDALEELKMQDGDVKHLSKQLQAVLQDAAGIRHRAQEDPSSLDMITGIAKDLMLDWHRFSGFPGPARQRLPQLEALLQDSSTCTADQLAHFILDTPAA